MLKLLCVQNYALIDRAEIAFGNGFTIITGETGAGKSVLLGALGLVLGERADTQSLYDRKNKCVIEGVFDIRKHDLKKFFQERELEYQEETILRREISSEGKSRAFINDSPVNLALLKELGLRLIDIHSQHETLSLNDSAFQLSVIDAMAQQEKLLEGYRKDHKEYKRQRLELELLLTKEAQSRKDLDYLQFQFQELDSAGLSGVSQEEMEEELSTLNNAEKIKEALSRATNAMDGGEGSLLTVMKEVKLLLAGISKYGATFNGLHDRLNSLLLELKDLSNETSNSESAVNYDPKRISDLNAQLDALYRLQHKHQVKTVEELLKIREDISEKLLGISSLETDIKKANTAIDELEEAMAAKAKLLSARRAKTIPLIEKEVSMLLADLAMPSGRLEIVNEVLDTPGPDGIDRVSFLFSANKGAAPKEIQKIASGGELSRLMLALKSLIARSSLLPTVIFDEIDTGISGSTAGRAGEIMRKMAGTMQVISISHLPQIAGLAASHLYVYKEEKGGKTFTRFRELARNERVEEIARLLSSGKPSEAALRNARELLEG